MQALWAGCRHNTHELFVTGSRIAGVGEEGAIMAQVASCDHPTTSCYHVLYDLNLHRGLCIEQIMLQRAPDQAGTGLVSFLRCAPHADSMHAFSREKSCILGERLVEICPSWLPCQCARWSGRRATCTNARTLGVLSTMRMPMSTPYRLSYNCDCARVPAVFESCALTLVPLQTF